MHPCTTPTVKSDSQTKSSQTHDTANYFENNGLLIYGGSNIWPFNGLSWSQMVALFNPGPGFVVDNLAVKTFVPSIAFLNDFIQSDNE